ncbi:hypothetical protein H8F23_07460 [Pseudomonas sp. P155]|uniref:Uncharacterized protein n=1 Tax=Pseudomonas neuropathica TaxID=2730425 RepID=A0ABS0BF40_9PSED|nr:hypothetical protein [Pseudomonas neuropathica]MBF6033079.1 hypothetical protein [Pseudomonas neuropathica]
MSEVSIVFYAPPPALLDALRDKECFVTSSYGNSIEQRDAAHRRELILKEELEFLTTRHEKVLAREEALEKAICIMRERNRCLGLSRSKSNGEDEI